MTARVNIADPEFTYDGDDPEGFRAGMFRFGKQLGAQRTGMSVYELPPGQAVCPYHFECGEEEWLLVLAGRPSVRTPAGTEQLEPFDVVYFAPGAEGAHQVRNDGDEPARVAMWSEVVVPTATVYPDSDKVGVWTGDRDYDVMVQRSSSVEYFHGERG
jgi:uncharacterized cupin superfamily protein